MKQKILVFLVTVILVITTILVIAQTVEATTEGGAKDGVSVEKLKIKAISNDKFVFKSLSNDVIEIGVETHSPPMLYLKLNKWDGEVSLKINVPYVRKEEPDRFGANEVVWGNEKYDVKFYPKEPEEIKEIDSKGNERTFTINDEGGVEFDLVLKKKPETNVFTYPIETKNLVYYYQPPLTQQEIDGGAFRPEHVVGSYAVYHKTKMNNEYKTGKAFHIYRPKVYEQNNENNWVWGELSIDEDKGVLIVIVDQNWLDKAVYPVVIDPTFGYTTLGASEYCELADKLALRIGNPGENGTADSISFGARLEAGTSAAWQGALYDASLGLLSPQTATGTVTSTTKQWWTLGFTNGPSVSNANFYCAAFSDAVTDNIICHAYDAGGVLGDGKYNNTGVTYNTWLNPFSGTDSASIYSIYATYTVANNPPTITSVSDSPDPVAVGNNITFSVDWNDADGEGIKMLICKTNNFTAGAIPSCDNGEWCSDKNDYDLTNPITCAYTTQSADVGSQNYYAYVCDDEPSCSSSTSGTFTVESPPPPPPPPAPSNVYGWAWSENIGWISFNCDNPEIAASCSTSNYGVDIDLSTGNFSGYAWAGGGENADASLAATIGWIKFNPAGPYPAVGPSYSACLDFPASISTDEACNGVGDYTVSGWARAYRAIEPEGQTLGGWDGWIKLKGIAQNGNPYGVSFNSATNEFQGWAWGSDVIGWISFNCLDRGVCGVSDYKVMADVNQSPDKPTTQDEGWGFCGTMPQIALRTSVILNWSYSDPDGDPIGGYEVWVDADSNFTGEKFNHLVEPSSSLSYALDLADDDDSDWLSVLSWNTTYWWKVRVKDINNEWSEFSDPDSFTIPNRASPNAGFTATPINPGQGEVVAFEDISECYLSDETGYFCKDGTTPPISYSWDFGDDSPIDTFKGSTTHTYSDLGKYVVRLEVTDSGVGLGIGMCWQEVNVGIPLPEWKEITPF